MKKNYLSLIQIYLSVIATLTLAGFARGQNEITIQSVVNPFGQKPIPVSISGFGSEVTDILKFDLYVQGFTFVSPDDAQYQIGGSSAGNVTGRVLDRFSKSTVLSKSYTGSTLRQQAHVFSDDIVLAITGKKGIAQTKIAFKVEQPSGSGEIYIADFDGYNAQAITHDHAIVAAPTWAPGRRVLYYTSYKLGNPDIFYHNLSTGERRVIAGHFRIEYERGGVAGRCESGDDSEQKRQPGGVAVRSGRLGFEAIDHSAGGRVVTLLVAGRPMDLFRGGNARTADTGQGARRRWRR